MVEVAAVFGLSGVGKSWLISRFAKTEEIAHVQASQLLREARAEISGRIESHEELRRGAVLDNQALLIDAFTKFRASATRPVIFDGHSIIDTGEQLLEIPVEVIQAIAPGGILFIKDEPASIIARRASDTARTRPVRSQEEILNHQARALTLCEQYTENLGVKLTIVQAGDQSGFSSAVKRILMTK